MIDYRTGRTVPRIATLNNGALIALDDIPEGEAVTVDLETPARAAERMTAEAARREP